MQTELTLAGVVAGFLILFWFTPLGIPTLKRFGDGQMSPDLRLHYGAEETYRLLGRYGTKGVAHWRRMLWLDMIFPAAYAALFAVLGLDWTKWVDAGPIWRLLAVSFPILAGASDYAENVLLLGVLAALPRQMPGRIAAASTFTTIKHLSALPILALPLLHWGAKSIGWLV
jgi:hypothetical protein